MSGGDDFVWDAYQADYPNLNISLDGRGRLTFTMPGCDVRLWIETARVSHDTEPDPDNPPVNPDPDPASIATVGDDGDDPSYFWDDDWDDDDF